MGLSLQPFGSPYVKGRDCLKESGLPFRILPEWFRCRPLVSSVAPPVHQQEQLEAFLNLRLSASNKILGIDPRDYTLAVPALSAMNSGSMETPYDVQFCQASALRNTKSTARWQTSMSCRYGLIEMVVGSASTPHTTPNFSSRESTLRANQFTVVNVFLPNIENWANPIIKLLPMSAPLANLPLSTTAYGSIRLLASTPTVHFAIVASTVEFCNGTRGGYKTYTGPPRPGSCPLLLSASLTRFPRFFCQSCPPTPSRVRPDLAAHPARSVAWSPPLFPPLPAQRNVHSIPELLSPYFAYRKARVAPPPHGLHFNPYKLDEELRAILFGQSLVRATAELAQPSLATWEFV
ncbi:hypothetical protein AG1IA_08802 [Rhizoctonia solani AG-1 IA]|uniref:Uncharacterized protein n=1 Tax=Thanatephorus cucumeris (strain AG1-IA) TaxID=983506 RepID=L8WK30_THACA|nr:hypothetical protein AG1IA_08802 [Rhizoctonia solani AG-1 IA]